MTIATKHDQMPAAGRQGRLRPLDAAYSNPIFGPPPHYYRGVEAISITFETDEDAAAGLLPEGLELPPGPVTAAIKVSRVGFSTLGSYHEAVLSLPCTWQGTPLSFGVAILADDLVGLIAGREVWGAPKTLARFDWNTEYGTVRADLRGVGGSPTISVACRPQRSLRADEVRAHPAVYLKVLPSPEEAALPEVCELVRLDLDFTVETDSDGRVAAFSGPGELNVHSSGEFDPWGLLPVGRVVDARWTKSNLVVPYGKILHRYTDRSAN